MQNIQGIVFTWSQAYKEMLKFAFALIVKDTFRFTWSVFSSKINLERHI